EPSLVIEPVMPSSDRLVPVDPLVPAVPLGTARAPSDDDPEGAECPPPLEPPLEEPLPPELLRPLDPPPWRLCCANPVDGTANVNAADVKMTRTLRLRSG